MNINICTVVYSCEIVLQKSKMQQFISSNSDNYKKVKCESCDLQSSSCHNGTFPHKTLLHLDKVHYITSANTSLFSHMAPSHGVFYIR